MKWANQIGKGLQWLLPSPFSIALVLTIFTFILALLFGTNGSGSSVSFLETLQAWEKGLWNPALLAFAIQMMLILVLGHCLALSAPVNWLIEKITKVCNTSAKAAAFVCFFTLIVAFFNWGLGLIFGAILARKVAENAKAKGYHINYPLVGAAGYSGFIIWHAGISGSATTKVAETGHLKSLMSGLLPPEKIALLPEAISFNNTVFSTMNLTLCLIVLVTLPLSLWLLGNKLPPKKIKLKKYKAFKVKTKAVSGAERIDHSSIVGRVLGIGIISYSLISTVTSIGQFNFQFITPNFINLNLLGLALIFHKSIAHFLTAIDAAIGGAAAILIQFPLYFGIMGVMKDTGLISQISDYFVSISTSDSYPLLSLASAGLVNVFVPSGGGQWAVQGPLLVHAALELNIPLEKCIMALCYGDQLTNMLQPFWALPLLGITGLKAKEILPYTIILMLIGGLIFSLGILLF